MDAAVQAAHKAFQPDAPWRTMDASARRDLMLKLADLVERDTLYLADLEALNNGKPSATHGKCYGAAYDVMLSVKCLRYYAGWADKIGGKTTDVYVPSSPCSLQLSLCACLCECTYSMVLTQHRDQQGRRLLQHVAARAPWRVVSPQPCFLCSESGTTNPHSASNSAQIIPCKWHAPQLAGALL